MRKHVMFYVVSGSVAPATVSVFVCAEGRGAAASLSPAAAEGTQAPRLPRCRPAALGCLLRINLSRSRLLYIEHEPARKRGYAVPGLWCANASSFAAW